MGREITGIQSLVNCRDDCFRIAGECAPDVDEIIADHANAHPALHATITPVPAAVEPVAALQHADAAFTTGPPFLPVAEPGFLLFPLPFGALSAQRSLLSLPNLAAAVQTVVAAPGQLRHPLIVADPAPLTVPQMITAMRRGIGRNPRLVPVPPRWLEKMFRLTGHLELYRPLGGPLVGDPARLLGLGWVPSAATRDTLADMTRRGLPLNT